ncbi:MAG: DASS family sodium-coupled anion symporter [Alphaproteobacteria bacterium GM202ARS2]|nr:DASS family sodium-coupled anion symporter [Alphaproteobacteria bacterium GM202ARS2]
MSYHRIGLFLGLLFMVAILVAPAPATFTPQAAAALALVVLMAVWWATQAIPLAATALIPIIYNPLANILSLNDTIKAYAHPVIYLLVGGALVAKAIQKCDLHKRFALTLLSYSPPNPQAIVLTLMVTVASLSMVISNTAATAMLLPIAMHIIVLVQGNANPSPFATSVILGLAYAASIGGTATLIGTPPNAIAAAYLAQNHDIHISFAHWLAFGLPLACILIPIAWLSLTRLSFPTNLKANANTRDAIKKERHNLGAMTTTQKQTFIVFVCLVSLWLTRPLLNTYPPLAGLSDAAIALLAALALFIMPTPNKKPLLDSQDLRTIPWDILLLFGGGLCLATTMNASGIIESLTHLFAHIDTTPLPLLIVLCVSATILLTELNSNTATIATFTPIFAALAAATNHSPLALIIPATIAASCAFMLPIATPPNAVAYASDKITLPHMMKAGILLNILATLIITIAASLIFAT